MGYMLTVTGVGAIGLGITHGGLDDEHLLEHEIDDAGHGIDV